MLTYGTGRCLCAGCGRYFGNVTAFDVHRDGKGAARVCRDPAGILTKGGEPRLRLSDAGYWVWAKEWVGFESEPDPAVTDARSAGDSGHQPEGEPREALPDGDRSGDGAIIGAVED